MSILSIITINRNNAIGLEKTLQSVLSCNRIDFEHIIVDGASTDDSVEIIRKYEAKKVGHLRWISEPDKGIYDAMNKGIRMASGDYLQFLNSGDCLVSSSVVDKMYFELKRNNYPSILYGNMLKCFLDGKVVRDQCFGGQEITFLGFYKGTLNHSPAYIRRTLFAKYGLYDESLRIVSDWKWYLQAIILGGEKPVYTDIDVTLFDMTGISETNQILVRKERRVVLQGLIAPAILADYDKWSFSILQIERLQKYPWVYKFVWVLERCLYKLEKWRNKRKQKIILR